MAQLFVQDGFEWPVAPLEREVYALGGDAEISLRTPPLADAADRSRPLILRASHPSCSGDEQWVVVNAPGRVLRINGMALATGIRVLSHRDELRVAGLAGRVFFSLEGLARVVPFDGLEGSRCPRCQQAIELGSPAVRCPQPRCGVWHHESEEFRCWTYSPTCALCDQPTELDAGFRWTPDEVTRDE
jgi:hypothetical protein